MIMSFIFVPNIFLLSFLCDRDTLSVGLQLVLNNFSISVMFYTEGVIQDTCDVIVPEEENTRLIRFLLEFNTAVLLIRQ